MTSDILALPQDSNSDTFDADIKASKLINKFIKNVRLLKKRCTKYDNNNKYVYTLLEDISSKRADSRKWLVVMKKTKKTETNESREVFDDKSAIFRASELRVVKIINTNNPKLTKKRIVSNSADSGITYKVGKIVRPNGPYCRDIGEIYEEGIYYFKTIIAAYYYERDFKTHTGQWYKWYDDGSIRESGECLNGEMTGHWIFYSGYGEKESEGDCLKGKYIGKWTCWHLNGEKESEGEYLNGFRTGKWTHWHENGEEEIEWFS